MSDRFEVPYYAHSITRAQNGWIANHEYEGPAFIAKSLHELATLVEGPAPVVEPIRKVEEFINFSITSVHMLKDAVSFAHEGRKIDAIKALRDGTSPRMSLKAAKELLEAMFY